MAQADALLRVEALDKIYPARESAIVALKDVTLAIGSTEDHLHLLVSLHRTATIAELLRRVKGASSHFVTHVAAVGEPFKWQGSYGAVTVSPDRLPSAERYVRAQREHHASNGLVAEWETTTRDRLMSTRERLRAQGKPDNARKVRLGKAA